MKYKELINRFRQAASDHLMIQDFGYGQLSDIKTQSQLGPEEDGADYPYMFLNSTTSNRNGPVMNYSFNVIMMDMARTEEGDVYDNYISIQSDCQQYIDDILARMYYFYTDKPDIQLTGITYTPFKEKYQDELAGMTATITIQVPVPINACVAPFDFYNALENWELLADMTLGPEYGEDRAFTYPEAIIDGGNWNVNKYIANITGSYRFTMVQNITLNQPAPGESIPNAPQMHQLTDLPFDPHIPATSMSGWPTVFENTSKIYNVVATWDIDMVTRPGGYTWQFMSLKDDTTVPESTLQQLAGGTIKISKLHVQNSVPTLICDALSTQDRTLDPDLNEYRFGFDTLLLTDGDLDISTYVSNKYTPTKTQELEFVIEGTMTLNEPAVGEVIPTQAILYQHTPTASITPAEASGWPTEFVDTTTVYTFRLVFRTMTSIANGHYNMALVNNQTPESSVNMLAGTTYKIYAI
jgi:hypothetical protein